MRAASAIVFAGILVALSCRTPRQEGSSTISAAEAEDAGVVAQAQANTLGPGDIVEIRVFQEADLTGLWRLSPEGVIDYPLCGKVRLSGLTSSAAADAVHDCLANGYVKNPQVTVRVSEYNSKKVFVFGEVQKPGTFPYDVNMSIVQAITLAGGFTKTAAQNNTNVTRIIDGQEKKIRVPVADIGVGREKNFLLQPGDIVFVPESIF